MAKGVATKTVPLSGYIVRIFGEGDGVETGVQRFPSFEETNKPAVVPAYRLPPLSARAVTFWLASPELAGVQVIPLSEEILTPASVPEKRSDPFIVNAVTTLPVRPAVEADQVAPPLVELSTEEYDPA